MGSLQTSVGAYLKKDWSIIPAHNIRPNGECSCGRPHCANPGKHPRIPWSPYQTDRADESVAAVWWKRWPQANIAIVTGTISGLVVLDIDTARGGAESLYELEQEHGPLPDTPTVLTGGGGCHYYFAHPGANRTISGGSGFRPGVDLRGDGGIVIAPPSSHASGRTYAWEVSAHFEDVPLAPLPPLVEWLIERRPHVLGEDVNTRSSTFDIEKVLEQPIPEGERNGSLAQIAGWFASRGDGATVVYTTLSSVNARLCKPPLPEQEVKTIARSICRREERKAQAQQALEAKAADLSEDGDVAEDDRLVMARELWKQLGVEAVADWVVLHSADEIEYVLETVGDEIRLGNSLIVQRPLQARLLDFGRLWMTPVAAKQWPAKALLLRRLAREVIIDTTRVGDRLAEWPDSYLEGRPPPVDVPSETRKDYLRSGPILVNGRLYLRPNKLAEYVIAALGERVTTSQVRKLLRQAGWESSTLKCGDTTTRAWKDGK